MNQPSSICFCVHPKCTKRPLCLIDFKQIMQHSSLGHVIVEIDSILDIIKTLGQDQLDKRINQQEQLLKELEEMKKKITSRIEQLIEEIKSNLLGQQSPQDKVMELIVDYQNKNISVQRLVELTNSIIQEKDDLSFLQEENLQEHFQQSKQIDLNVAKQLRDQLNQIIDILGLEKEEIKQDKKLIIKLDQINELMEAHDKVLYTDLEIDLKQDLNIFLKSKALQDANQLKHLQSFEGLRRLKVKLTNNLISDISFLQEISTLKQLREFYIYLWQNKVKDITPVIHLKLLTKLNKLSLEFYDNQITDLTPLNSLPEGLETLWVGFRNNPINDISSLNVLAKMQKLRNLIIDLSYTKITSIEVLEVLGKLKELRVLQLWLYGTQIQDLFYLQVLKECQSLEFLQLDLTETKVTNFDFFNQLKDLKGLKYLVVIDNDIQVQIITKLKSIFNDKQVEIVAANNLLSEQGKKLRNEALQF